MDEFGNSVKVTPTDVEQNDRNVAECLLSFYYEEKTCNDDYVFDINTTSKYRIKPKKLNIIKFHFMDPNVQKN